MQRVLARLFGFLACATLVGCSGDAFEYTDDALLLPASIREAYEIAEAIALEWSEAAYPTTLGGSFNIVDANGRGRNHSFEFHTREDQLIRRLTVHLIEGTPWTQDAIVPTPDPPFPDFSRVVDSDVVVGFAINIAQSINEMTHPDSIPIPQDFAARLLSVPVYPERTTGDPVTELAWRVDFLELDIREQSNSLVYWSTARFYFNPISGVDLGPAVIPETGREIYPFP